MTYVSKKARNELNRTCLKFAKKNEQQLTYELNQIVAIIGTTMGYSRNDVMSVLNMLNDCGAIQYHKQPVSDHPMDKFNFLVYPELTTIGHDWMQNGITINVFLEE